MIIMKFVLLMLMIDNLLILSHLLFTLASSELITCKCSSV